MDLTLQQIDHIHVFVADRAAAETWYTRVLGFRRIPELAVWATDGGPLTIGDASGNIHLALFERPAEKCRSTIAMRAGAEQFLAWLAHLRAALGRVAVEDHQLSWSLYFSDPDGNPFEITSYEVDALAPALRASA